MNSAIAWLDTSADEQRRARELIALFSQQESRDELGVGQIRDAFSDALFPGTSTLHTRARYFLIVPWTFRFHAARGRSGQDLLVRAETTERSLVEVLNRTGETQGIIGRRIGAAVKNLPSSVYWSGLRTFGILTRDVARDRLLPSRARTSEASELVTRVIGDWETTLPEPPEAFPRELPGGLALSHSEAAWLRERILAAVPQSLLAHLVAADCPPDTTSIAPWHDPVCCTAPHSVSAVLGHAQLFSLVMQGASLLYNLLVAERYESSAYTRVEDPVATYRDRYDAWLQDVNDHKPQLTLWKLDDFWECVLAVNPRVSPVTRSFVIAWTDHVLNGAANAPDDLGVRRLVSEREQLLKKSQSRLTNDKLLGSWSGESGAGRLTFRWPNVRTIVTDIHDGLKRA